MKKIDGELFYMGFSVALALIILYMAVDWHNSINAALDAMTYGECMKKIYGGMIFGDYDVMGSMVFNESEITTQTLNFTFNNTPVR